MLGLELHIGGLHQVTRDINTARQAALGWRGARSGIKGALSREMRRYPIPVLSGQLKASLTHPSHPAQICQVQGTRVTWGSALPYARTRLGGLPRLGLDGFVLVLEEHIERNLKKRGGA